MANAVLKSKMQRRGTDQFEEEKTRRDRRARGHCKAKRIRERERLRMYLSSQDSRQMASRITGGLNSLDVDTLKSYTVLGLRGRCKVSAWCRRSSDQSLLSLRRSCNVIVNN